MPVPRNQFSTVVFDDKIYAIGGHTTPVGGAKSTDPDILRLSRGGRWEVIGELPMPLSSPAAAIIEGKLIVGGGATNGSNVAAKMWSRPEP